jgi:aminopeptidase N
MAEDPQTRPAMIRALLRGFQQPEQEELLAPYAERYFEALARIWEERDTAVALLFARGGYPGQVVTERTIELTDLALGASDLPAPLRRPLLEGKDGVLRAIRARATDAGQTGRGSLAERTARD